MSNVANRVIQWQLVHGRHDLPWQKDSDPYHVWVSEVMLQQTQVSTVIDYYTRFIKACPTVQDLSLLPEDDLMILWQGLGYYSRARNLHRSAKIIMSEYGGVFPSTHESLLALPGIGRSTAAAIMSLAYNQPDAILDGNVKRVLARYHGILDNLKDKVVLEQLWSYAKQHVTKDNPRAYTQGMMDLGANICKRSKAACQSCPLSADCKANKQGIISLIPAKQKKKKAKPMDLYILWVIHEGRVGFVKRHEKGIWPKLYSPLLFDSKELLHQYTNDVYELASYKHQLTHLSLTIHSYATYSDDGSITHWQDPNNISLGIPTGVRRSLLLLQSWVVGQISDN